MDHSVCARRSHDLLKDNGELPSLGMAIFASIVAASLETVTSLTSKQEGCAQPEDCPAEFPISDNKQASY